MTGEAIFPKERVSLEPTLPAKRARYYSQENNFYFSWPGVPGNRSHSYRSGLPVCSYPQTSHFSLWSVCGHLGLVMTA
jgi:hypothetical protein